MHDRLTSFDSLIPASALPRVEDGLRRRLARLDARVDELLVLDGPPTDDEVAEVDVLCAAIGELQELLDELTYRA